MLNPTLCQINLAHARWPLEDPRMVDFVDALDYINRLGEKHDGFVWRYKSEESDEPSPWPNDILIKMTVWRDIDSLLSYVYRTHHKEYVRRRREWFHKMTTPALALWWVEDDHIPTLAEAKDKLDRIQHLGPTQQAFHFGKRFAAPSMHIKNREKASAI